jgi:hypothetical protein
MLTQLKNKITKNSLNILKKNVKSYSTKPFVLVNKYTKVICQGFVFYKTKELLENTEHFIPNKQLNMVQIWLEVLTQTKQEKHI